MWAGSPCGYKLNLVPQVTSQVQMKTLYLLSCIFLSVFYQVNCSIEGVTDGLSNSDSDNLSFTSIEAVTKCVQMKRPRLWNFEEEIHKIYAISDFWKNIFEGNLEMAESLRFRNNLRILPSDGQTHENVLNLLADPKTSLITLNYLYQNFPQIFNFPYFQNVFITSRQEVLDNFYENYSGDSNLMKRLLEACCFNQFLTLPDEFFAVEDPVLAIENIELVKRINSDSFNTKLLRKCYEKPESLLERFKNGETVLTDALKQSNSYEIISWILARSDAEILVSTRNSQGQLPSELKSTLNSFLKGKLSRKIQNNNK